MTTENSENKPSLYAQLSEIKPPRSDVAIATSDDSSGLGENGGSLKKRMDFAPRMSDFQVVDKRLFPILKETVEWLNNLMIARVLIEEVIPLKSIITKHLLGEYPEISFAEAYCIAEVAVSVPIDSEGRIDIVRVFAKAGEMEAEKEKSKL